MNSFVICSYYTLDTPYAGIAHKYLLKSLSKLGEIKSDICGVQSLGSWQANTSFKPLFIQKMLERHQGADIVFVDADAEILSYPSLFNEIPETYHIAAHILDRNAWYKQDLSGNNELLSGTLFIRNSEAARYFLQEWVRRCKSLPNMWEQAVLQKVVVEMRIPLYELPISYCYIKSLPNGANPHVECSNPIIVHNQVSRQLRPLIH